MGVILIPPHCLPTPTPITFIPDLSTWPHFRAPYPSPCNLLFSPDWPIKEPSCFYSGPLHSHALARMFLKYKFDHVTNIPPSSTHNLKLLQQEPSPDAQQTDPGDVLCG